MPRQDKQEKFINLRKEYPCFIYEAYSIRDNDLSIEISFDFSLDGKFSFHPRLVIPKKEFFLKDKIKPADDPAFRNLVFHLGMIELVSYWKAACPPKLVIRPHTLSENQVNWWKNLYFKGLGEFFYLNSIETGINSFLEIGANEGTACHPFTFTGNDHYLIPVGGGKDSAITIDLLSKNFSCTPFIINPRAASLESAFVAGYHRDDILEVQRTIDPLLLKLNEQGFLNGHTPFSAVLAFTALIGAWLCGQANIALSNESSANEATIPGTLINHQYSKSIDFERDFRDYCSEHISPGFNYFSFLRPLSELQIAALFSRLPAYFRVFKSCNTGSRDDRWCCNCPKCLFTYIILSPFTENAVLRQIFGEDLFDRADLEETFMQLTGKRKEKPFDCIGTVDEVNYAVTEAIRHYPPGNLPYLLKKYADGKPGKEIENFPQTDVFHLLNHEHFLDQGNLKILKERINAG